jgi:hypothetical protein
MRTSITYTDCVWLSFRFDGQRAHLDRWRMEDYT